MQSTLSLPSPTDSLCPGMVAPDSVLSMSQIERFDTWIECKFFRKIYLSLYWKGCVWEGVGDHTELQHIDLHSIGHNRVSFPFSWAVQPGAWGPASLGHVPQSSIFSPTCLIPNWLIGAWGFPLLGAGFFYRILSPTDLVSKLIEFPVHWFI